MKKEEIITHLQAAGIQHDPTAKKDELEALLPPELATAPSVADARQSAWEKFLVKVEADAVKNGTTHVFNLQKERGEFNKIPDSFIS